MLIKLNRLCVVYHCLLLTLKMEPVLRIVFFILSAADSDGIIGFAFELDVGVVTRLGNLAN